MSSTQREVVLAGKEDLRKSKRPVSSDDDDDDDEEEEHEEEGTQSGSDTASESDDEAESSAIDDSGDESGSDDAEGAIEDDALFKILNCFFTTSDGINLADVISGAQLYDNLKGIRSELHAMNKHIHGILQKLGSITKSK